MNRSHVMFVLNTTECMKNMGTRVRRNITSNVILFLLFRWMHIFQHNLQVADPQNEGVSSARIEKCKESYTKILMLNNDLL